MQEFIFDISGCYSPEEVHEVIADNFTLPEYYGGNLDALYDVLTELSGEYRITFRGCQTASAVIGAKYLRSLQRMADAVMKANEGVAIVFED